VRRVKPATVRRMNMNVSSGRRTLSQVVTAEILDRIRAGQYRPGDRLATERTLMAEFGVGRNVAREALQALLAMGLVEIRPGRGAIVIGVDTERAMDPGAVSALLLDQTVDDLYQFRRVIEVEIATRAATHATEDDIRKIREKQDAFRADVEEGRPVAALDVAVHQAIAEASHNSIYASVLAMLEGLLANTRSMVESIDWARNRSVEDHDAIVNAIAAGNPERAGEAMRRHLITAVEAMAAARAARGDARDGDVAPPAPAELA
jgi:GntR family transcriptional regulator, transcriptional repressor for pyruvate dehydrogenase complex